MANKKIIWGMSALALIFGLALLGCATNVASHKEPNWDKKPIGIEGHDYTILGAVKLEKPWMGILGMTDPKGGDVYVYQKGGVTYADLVEEARKQYSDTDAVIDVTIDFNSSFYGIFYARRVNIVTGIAIKYVKEPKPNVASPSIDIRLK
jgi:hypothetical protein